MITKNATYELNSSNMNYENYPESISVQSTKPLDPWPEHYNWF